MTDWQTLRLGDVGEIITGATPRKSNPQHFGHQGLAFLTLTDISWDRRRPEYMRYISDSGIATFRRRMLPPNTPCFVAIGATIGKVTLPDREVLSNQQIHGVIAQPELASPSFIYYLLREASTRISASVTGSTMPIINKTDFSSLKFQFPPLEEQERIAGVLGAFDDLIETNLRTVEYLDRMFQLLWSQDYSRRTNESKLALSEVASTQYGLTASASAEREGVKFLRVTDINKQNWINWERVPMISEALAQGRKYRLEPGDLLVARMADPGKSAIYEGGPRPSSRPTLSASSQIHTWMVCTFTDSSSLRSMRTTAQGQSGSSDIWWGVRRAG